jgi:hypothetical protein
MKPQTDVLICAIEKCSGERYIVLYDDSPEERREALRTLGRWAADPELSFTWYDAAYMSGRIRNSQSIPPTGAM